MGSKTPFKDIQDNNDLKAANETLIRDFKTHLSELADFVSSLRIEESKTINLDDYLAPTKRYLK
jgi:hypothetical protein